MEKKNPLIPELPFESLADENLSEIPLSLQDKLDGALDEFDPFAADRIQNRPLGQTEKKSSANNLHKPTHVRQRSLKDSKNMQIPSPRDNLFIEQQ